MSIDHEIPVIRIECELEGAGIVSEMLATIENMNSSVWAERSGICKAEIYCAGVEDLDEKFAWLTDNLKIWGEFLPGLEVTRTTMVKEDWADTWKKYFHPLQISERVSIKPTWEELPFSPTECVIEIDPGMSFGTGRHGTTAACLEMIDISGQTMKGARFLDIGCGSGILSIAAAKLGFAQVELFDFDPVAVENAVQNVELNELGRLKPFVCDIAEYSCEEPFDMVVANLEAHILLPNVDAICSTVSLRSGSILILSGILDKEYNKVIEHFTNEGFREVSNRGIAEWRTGCFERIS